MFIKLLIAFTISIVSGLLMYYSLWGLLCCLLVLGLFIGIVIKLVLEDLKDQEEKQKRKDDELKEMESLKKHKKHSTQDITG